MLGEHEDEEKEKIIQKYSRKCYILEKYLNKIIQDLKMRKLRKLKI